MGKVFLLSKQQGSMPLNVFFTDSGRRQSLSFSSFIIICIRPISILELFPPPQFSMANLDWKKINGYSKNGVHRVIVVKPHINFTCNIIAAIIPKHCKCAISLTWPELITNVLWKRTKYCSYFLYPPGKQLVLFIFFFFWVLFLLFLFFLVCLLFVVVFFGCFSYFIFYFWFSIALWSMAQREFSSFTFFAFWAQEFRVTGLKEKTLTELTRQRKQNWQTQKSFEQIWPMQMYSYN